MCETDTQAFFKDLKSMYYDVEETYIGGILVSRDGVRFDLSEFELYPKNEVHNNNDCCIAVKKNKTGTYSTVLKFYSGGVKVLFDVQVQKDQD